VVFPFIAAFFTQLHAISDQGVVPALQFLEA
jgi:hypothetical protein